jgi:hypothetical protein
VTPVNEAPKRTIGRRAALAALALAAVSTGCGSTARQTTPPTTAAPAPAPTATSPPAPTTVPATIAPSSTTVTTTVPTPTTAPSTPVACEASDLLLTLGSGGAGLGHEGVALLFKNVGGVACILHGYPGVALLDASGRQAEQAVRAPSGYLGGLTPGATTPPTLVVRPGQTDSALLEGTDVATGSATSCPSYLAALVTAPNQTVSTRLKLVKGSSREGFPGCSPVEIHPIVKGTTGSQQG